MCQDCFNNCNGEVISDRCVKYTGPDIPFLGISTGDSLSMVEAAIIAKLQAMTLGTGVDLSAVTIDCELLTDIIGTQDKNLVNLVQMLITASCTLRELIQELQDIVDTPFTINTDCLTLPANPTRDQVLEATVLKLCSVAADVLVIKNDYVKATQLNGLIQAYLNTIGLGGGGSSTTQQYVKMVPKVAYEYYGSLSNFDSSGKGIAAAGFDKVYLCNGSNGTPDKRGRVAVGAVQGVPGGTLDPEVDPALPANPGTNIAVGGKLGTYYVQLTTSQMPGHTHGVTDPGHKHLAASGWYLFTANNSGSLSSSGNDAVDSSPRSNDGLQNALTGITIQSAGGNQAHTNIQPSIGALFIMYIP
jgi:microcystin-dependent protein